MIRRHDWLFMLHLGLTLFFLYGPIVVLVVLSFNELGLATAWGGFSLKWYAALSKNFKIISAAVNTLIVASVTTVIATIIGTMLAMGIERLRKSPLLDALLFAPMVVPDIVLAIGLLSLFTAINLKLGLHSIIMSHVVFNIAFVCAVVRTRLNNFDHSLLEASTDLGASTWTTFRRVTLPIIFPGVFAGALLAFTLSFDEFVIAFFTAGTRQSSTTLPMQIYSMIKFGIKPDINALATIIMGVSFILVFIAQRLNKEALTGR